MYVDVLTDSITRNNEPLFNPVLWFVLGRGSKMVIPQDLNETNWTIQRVRSRNLMKFKFKPLGFTK